MTAEIAIMNKEAIALAADSAVTMIGQDQQKIKTSANKLFSLSKFHPVGIMIYGSSVFMGIPWETIIKIYRGNLGKTGFATLSEYAQNFIGFLETNKDLFPLKIQETYFYESVLGYYLFLKEKLSERIGQDIRERGEVTNAEAELVFDAILEEQYSIWAKCQNIPSIPVSFNAKITEKYAALIDRQ